VAWSYDKDHGLVNASRAELLSSWNSETGHHQRPTLRFGTRGGETDRDVPGGVGGVIRSQKDHVRISRIIEELKGSAGLFLESQGSPDHLADRVTGISYDSRSVDPGDLFACLVGLRLDGHAFAEDAVSSGARVLLVERYIPSLPDAMQIRVSDARLALAIISSAFHGYPTRNLLLVGITGTSGKTTTAQLVRQVFEKAGVPTGYIGTLGTVVGGVESPGTLTTPEAPDLAATFAAMRDAGDRAAVIEVSSHSLAFRRVAGCAFDLALFTNIAPEHLDFHRDMEDYVDAKAALFRMLDPDSSVHVQTRGIFNADDPMGPRVVAECSAPTLGFGITCGDIRAIDLHLSLEGSDFTLRYPDGGSRRLCLRLPARYNVYNAIAAAAVAECAEITRDVVAQALEEAQPVPGRFEVIGGEGDPMVVVDFAHTADELENLLEAVRGITDGHVIAVFGCGGDRDRTKRPVMAETVSVRADYTIITSDNPRSEDPGDIAAEVARGIRQGSPHEVIVNREEAIMRAVSLAQPGDVVVLAGKGHETYQIFAEKTIDFDDREKARRALAIRRRGRAQ